MTTAVIVAVPAGTEQGPNSTNGLAFRHHNLNEKVPCTRMEDHYRFATARWQAFKRPSHLQDEMYSAKIQADMVFDMFGRLGVSYFCWHDAGVRLEDDRPHESIAREGEITDYFLPKAVGQNIGCLRGSANIFSHRCWMSGASTRPDPDVFAFAAICIGAPLKSDLDTVSDPVMGYDIDRPPRTGRQEILENYVSRFV